MIKNKFLQSCKLLITINIVFWLFISFYFSFFEYPGNSSYLLIKILLFTEPLFYLISLIGLIRRIKLIYLFSIILAFGNTILSLTDQINLSDIISLILSLLVLVNLFLLWKYIFKKS